MASIYPRGETWWVKYRDSASGLIVRRSLKTSSEREAKKLLAALKVRLRDGRAVDSPKRLTVRALGDRFLVHAEATYIRDASRRSVYYRIARVINLFIEVNGNMPAEAVRPKHVLRLREKLIADRISRKVINSYIFSFQRMYRWAVTQDLVRVEAHMALQTIEGLRRGSSNAKELDRVQPAPLEHIYAVENYMPRIAWCMLIVQLLTACRSGEIISIRVGHLDRSGDVWIARLPKHKTMHHGGGREIFFGPVARWIIEPLIEGRGPDDFLFSPLHPLADMGGMKAHGVWQFSEQFGQAWFYKSIRAACKAAGIPPFSPHRVRHTAATLVRKQFGIEAAQLMLGHSRADVTQIYAERDAARAIEVAAQIG